MNEHDVRANPAANSSIGPDAHREAATQTPARSEPARSSDGRAVTIRVSSPVNPMSSPSFWFGAFAILLGVVVSVLPLLWDAAAEMLESLGDARVHSVSLVVGGMLILTLGGHSDNLARIRRVIESMGNELTRLEQLAFENRRQSAALQNIQVGHQDVKEEVIHLRQAVEHLSELSAQQEQTKAMVKLAGSVDQVRARLETSVKEQFGMLHKQLGQNLEGIERATKSVLSTLGELESAFTEQGQSQRLALREGLEEVGARQDKLKGAVERAHGVAAELQREWSEQRAELERMAEAIVREPRAIAQQLSEATRALLERSEEQARAQLERSDEHARTLAEALASVEGHLAPQVQEFGKRVVSELEVQRRAVSEQSAALSVALEASGRAQSQWTQQFEKRLSTQLGEQRVAAEKLIQASSSRAVEAVQASSSALSASMERLGERLESQANEQTQQFAQRVEQSVQASSSRAMEAVQASSSALSASMERLGERLESQANEQTQQFAQRVEQSMQASSSRAMEAVQASSSALSASMERLGERLESQANEQTQQFAQRVESSMGDSTARAIEATQAANAALMSNLGQLAAFLERQPQSPGTGEMVEAFEHALGHAISRIIGATRQANAEIASSLQQLSEQVSTRSQADGGAPPAAASMAGADLELLEGLIDHRLLAHESAIRDALTHNGEMVLSASIEISAAAERLASSLGASSRTNSAAQLTEPKGAMPTPADASSPDSIAAPLPSSRGS